MSEPAEATEAPADIVFNPAAEEEDSATALSPTESAGEETVDEIANDEDSEVADDDDVSDDGSVDDDEDSEVADDDDVSEDGSSVDDDEDAAGKEDDDDEDMPSLPPSPETVTAVGAVNISPVPQEMQSPPPSPPPIAEVDAPAPQTLPTPVPLPPPPLPVAMDQRPAMLRRLFGVTEEEDGIPPGFATQVMELYDAEATKHSFFKINLVELRKKEPERVETMLKVVSDAFAGSDALMAGDFQPSMNTLLVSIPMRLEGISSAFGFSITGAHDAPAHVALAVKPSFAPVAMNGAVFALTLLGKRSMKTMTLKPQALQELGWFAKAGCQADAADIDLLSAAQEQSTTPEPSNVYAKTLGALKMMRVLAEDGSRILMMFCL